MSIMAAAIAAAPIASTRVGEVKGGKTPPKRLLVAAADAPLVPEAR